MRDSIIILCLFASGIINFYLLWLCWRWDAMANMLLQELTRMRKADLRSRSVA